MSARASRAPRRKRADAEPAGGDARRKKPLPSGRGEGAKPRSILHSGVDFLMLKADLGSMYSLQLPSHNHVPL